MSKSINLVEIQEAQKSFVKFLEERPGMINVKNKYGVTKQQALCLLSELYEVENEVKSTHKWWDKSTVKQNRVLEEMTDFLSHLCNVADQLGVKLDTTCDMVQIECLEGQFLSLTRHIYELPYLNKVFYTKQKIMTIFKEYIQLLYGLGFTVEQLESAYYDKLEVNYRRFK